MIRALIRNHSQKPRAKPLGFFVPANTGCSSPPPLIGIQPYVK